MSVDLTRCQCGQPDRPDLQHHPEHCLLVNICVTNPVAPLVHAVAAGESLHEFLVTEDERWVLVNALEDYAEWAADAANDKRNEAEHADPPDEGLDAEADHYEADRTTALALVERIRERAGG